MRPTIVDIDLAALRRNYHAIRQHAVGAQVMPILKADAYGHGLLEVARCLEQEGAPFFGVAYFEEGLALREAGIQTPILCLGGISGRQIVDFIEQDLDLTASSKFKLDAIDEIAQARGKQARIHLKIDTGMERIGVHHYSSDAFLERALSCKHCQIVGIFSHFAKAEDLDQSYSRLQLERFLEITSFFEKRSLPMPLRHIANSGGLLKFPDSHLDLVRPGLALYGINPMAGEAAIDLSPVLSLRTEVSYFKVIPADTGVSYNHTWRSKEQTRVVTLPAGYGDGYSRSLSNKAEVLIRGIRRPLVGNICMDQMMVNLGADGEAYNADEAVLIGQQGNESIGVWELANKIGTDPREVLLNLSLRIPKRFIDSD